MALSKDFEEGMSEAPLVSFVLIAYNQERFIREAIQSAFEQTYSPLEIILSDDCSSDRTFEIMKEEASVYQGPHKVILNRNHANLGLTGNLHKAYQLSQGDFLVIAAGDDLSVPERVEKLYRRWKETSVDLVCSYCENIDIASKPTGYIKKNVVFLPDISKDPLQWRCGASGACASYSRKLFEKYGPVSELVASEDWVYSFRAWLECGIAVVEEPLVKHRVHSDSIGFMHQNVHTLTDDANRKKIRRKGVENSLGIAQEWLHAWQLSGQGNDARILLRLKRLVKIREMEYRAYESTRVEALKLAILFFIHGGGFKYAVKILVRNVLRWG